VRWPNSMWVLSYAYGCSKTPPYTIRRFHYGYLHHSYTDSSPTVELFLRYRRTPGLSALTVFMHVFPGSHVGVICYWPRPMGSAGPRFQMRSVETDLAAPDDLAAMEGEIERFRQARTGQAEAMWNHVPWSLARCSSFLINVSSPPVQDSPMHLCETSWPATVPPWSRHWF